MKVAGNPQTINILVGHGDNRMLKTVEVIKENKRTVWVRIDNGRIIKVKKSKTLF